MLASVLFHPVETESTRRSLHLEVIVGDRPERYAAHHFAKSTGDVPLSINLTQLLSLTLAAGSVGARNSQG